MNNRVSDARIAAQIRAKTAAMRQALEGTRMAVPAAQMGALAGIAPAWEAGKTYEPGALFSYGGMVGFARQTVTAQETYPPFSAGTEALYGVRPAPGCGRGVPVCVQHAGGGWHAGASGRRGIPVYSGGGSAAVPAVAGGGAV